MRRRAGRGAAAALALVLLVFVWGCAQHARVICDPLEKASRRDFDEAVSSLDETKLAESGRDRFLYHAQRAHLLHLAGRYEASNAEFERAVRVGEELEPTSVTATLADYTINEAVKAYPGEDYERAYLHYYMALNYLALDDQEAALVECRRLDRTFRELDARYDDDRYQDDGFIRYLSGLIYEATGRTNDAYVDYKAAVRAYTRERPGRAGLPDGLVASLLATARRLGLEDQAAALLEGTPAPAGLRAGGAVTADGRETAAPDTLTPGPRRRRRRPTEIVVIVNAGWAPYKREKSIEVPIYRPLVPEHLRGEDWLSALIKIAYPELTSVPLPAAGFEITASSAPDTAADPAERKTSAAAEEVKDLDALARRTLERRIGALKLRSTMRATAKQLALMKQKADHAEARKDRSFGERFLWSIIERTATMLTAETEQADTRSWVTLPREIWIARVPVAPGTYSVSVRPFGGTPYDLGVVSVRQGSRVFRPVRVFGGPHPVRCDID
jgi:hypothetical protein